MVNYKERKFKLGMHTYTLHLNGCGQNWGFVGDTFEQADQHFPADGSGERVGP